MLNAKSAETEKRHNGGDMGEVRFEEVKGFDVPGALNGEKIEFSSVLNDGNKEHTQEHIYVVFSDGFSIENGIKAIEDKALAGQKLDIRIKDEFENSISIVVSSEHINIIGQLPEVKSVKVEEAAVLHRRK